MRRGTYLNVILTVNATLIAGLLWTQVADTPLLSGSAQAQNRTFTPAAPTIPNASKQRNAMIQAVREVQTSVNDLRRSIESGVKVEVTNADEIASSD